MRKSIALLVVLVTATFLPSRAPALLLNLSTRVEIPKRAFGVDSTSLIGGFIVGGSSGRKIVIRAIGPSLADFGLTPLVDPILELHDATGAVIATNDNWMSSQEQEIKDSGLAPLNSLESAILMVLPPGSYTAIVRGVEDPSLPAAPTGTALVEVYDISLTVAEGLSNLSTRAPVQLTADPMIMGLVVANGSDETIVFRAIGPSLTNFGLTGLRDPRLDLFDRDGNVLASNDNWQETQAAEIAATGLAPSDPLEAAILITLPRGTYTAILAPVEGVPPGVALAELYKL
ncbi:MAG: hypothetical protein ABI787_02520 [Spartobacteria bacterium]